MHGVPITFDCAASAEDIKQPFTDYAVALKQ